MVTSSMHRNHWEHTETTGIMAMKETKASTVMNLRDLETYILLNVNLECQGAKNTCGNCVLCGLECSCLILFNNVLLNCCDYLARNKVIRCL
jgi:hypothetical protein